MNLRNVKMLCSVKVASIQSIQLLHQSSKHLWSSLYSLSNVLNNNQNYAQLRQFATSQHLSKRDKTFKPIRSPIEYDYPQVPRKKSKIKIKIQDLENRPETVQNFFDHEQIQRIINEQQMEKWMKVDNGDLPVEGLPNPYAKAPAKCILCQHTVDLDYKNTRLLSQFVSPFTGQIMGRHITGLCVYMQHRVRNLIKRAQYFGFMPYTLKEPDYLKDPRLFDPLKRKW